ncbi:MAG: hypothetical protein FJW27_08890 [Acidimicrobiia bacterium]|nr:hypothetical protein [Acidimicrobiia bacterium]
MLVRIQPEEPFLLFRPRGHPGGIFRGVVHYRIGKQIKGLAEFRRKLPLPPRAVRYQEIEQPPLFARSLAFKQAAGASCEFEKPHAVSHVRLVGGLMVPDQPQALGLFGTPLLGEPIERGRVDSPVQLVHVHRVHPVLKSCVLCLQPRHGLVVGLAFVFVALSKGLAYPAQNVVVEHEAVQTIDRISGLNY